MSSEWRKICENCARNPKFSACGGLWAPHTNLNCINQRFQLEIFLKRVLFYLFFTLFDPARSAGFFFTFYFTLFRVFRREVFFTFFTKTLKKTLVGTSRNSCSSVRPSDRPTVRPTVTKSAHGPKWDSVWNVCRAMLMFRVPKSVPAGSGRKLGSFHKKSNYARLT